MAFEARDIGIGMIGCGTVGGGVATLLRDQAALYERRLGRPLRLRKVLVRDAKKARQGGAASELVTTDADAFFATADMPIIVEVAGGAGTIHEHVRRAITTGRHVVTANKSLLAAHGAELFALARRHQVSIAFEASCCGGIPVITALHAGLMANRIDALYGILNGTCNYILTEMTQQRKPYDVALSEAQQHGYAEADPTLDVSGMDAAQKLCVLASLAFGAQVTSEQVRVIGIDQLELTDIRFAAEMGYDIKLLGIAEAVEGKLSLTVQPCFLHKDVMLAQVRGPFNALSVYGHATGQTMYYGRGAGALPTASAIVSDVINLASGGYPHAFAALNLWSDQQPAARIIDHDDLCSRFYVRINAMDRPGTMARVTQALGEAGISLSAVMQHESGEGKFVPVVVLTHRARWGSLRQALAKVEALDVIDGRPVCIRIVDLPDG
ncbi:MAG: homoserine dehydrogenase [Phycisphaeraceae bacterium]